MSSLEAQPCSARGLYVFCVTPDTAPCPEEAGLTSELPLRMVSHRGLGAVLCDVALEEWVGAAGEAHLKDLKWLGPRAVQHELVIERALASGPLLPLRFGCIFSGEASLRGWLERHAATISEFIFSIRGKQEWSVKGWLNPERAAAELASRDPRFQELPASPGVRYLREQKLRQELARSVQKWGREIGSEVLVALAPHYERQRALRALPGSASGRREEIVFHHALLIEATAIEGLHEAVDKLNAELEGRGLELALTGPWPPYSFCPSLGEGASNQTDTKTDPQADAL